LFEDEVAGFIELYQSAIEARDVDVLGALYADDGRFEWVEDGAVRYRSPEDVLAGLAGLPSGSAIHTEYERRSIIPVGDIGARVSTRFRTVVGEGESAFEFGGMMTMVLEKGPAGWRLLGGHTSSTRQGGR